jgi:C4-dicarboxylate-specific signal transduction histidine kinase
MGSDITNLISAHPRVSYWSRLTARIGAGYVVAVVVSMACFALRVVIEPVFEARSAFILFVPAPIIAAALGGFWPAMFAAALGVGAAAIYSGRALVDDPANLISAIIFVAISVASGLAADYLARGRRAQAAAIDDLLAAEVRLRDLQGELTHLSRSAAAGAMAATLAHELNQPLLAVSSYASAASRLLRQPDHDRGVVEEAMRHVAEQALRAGEIIRRHRAFVATGEVQASPEQVSAIFKDSGALAMAGVRDLAVQPTFDIQAGVDKVMADSVQIQQVMSNLLRNALEAMEETPNPRLRVVARRVEQMVEISVADNGRGVDPDATSHLFQAFVSKKPHGLGVGLAICRTIIEAHGGTIWFESVPGGGSDFKFTLPAERAAA